MIRIVSLSFAFTLVSAACGGQKNVQCEIDNNCNLSGGGVCTLNPATGNHWCAYPDPECPTGSRWSDLDVGDGLSGECVAGDRNDAGVDGGSYALTVVVAGSGGGVVTSMPTGLTCSDGTCMQTFGAGAQVMLSQSASTGAFLGWTNDCTGMGACTVTMDRDRTVTAMFGAPGEALWSQQIGGTMQDRAEAITIDSDGNLIVVGSFWGSFMVGNTTYTSTGSADVFVAKLAASDGSIVWLKTFGGTNAEGVADVALDASDNIYIAGSFSGSTDLSPIGGGQVQGAGSNDGYALKLNSSGAYQWVKTIGGISAEGSLGIAVRGSTVAVVGTYQGSMTVNGQTVSNAGTSQGYLVTFGTDGSAGIVKTFPGSGYSSAGNVVIDNSGNIVIAGGLSGSADFGNGPVNSAMGDMFFAKYTAGGSYIIAKVVGGSSNDSGGAIAVDPADNIFIAGTFTGSVSFGGPPVNANTANLVVAKYSSAGAYQWAQPFGGTTAQISAALEVNAAGDLVLAGSFCGSVSFGSTFLASVGTCASNDHDIFAARLAGTDGSALRAMRAGGSSQDIAYDVTQTSDGRHFVAAKFQGFADFGGTSRTSAGADDAIVLGLAPL